MKNRVKVIMRNRVNTKQVEINGTKVSINDITVVMDANKLPKVTVTFYGDIEWINPEESSSQALE